MRPQVGRPPADVANGSASIVLAVVVLLSSACIVGVRAQHALVARARDDWQARFVTALAAIERGDHGRGVEALQRAIVEGDDVVIRVPAGFDGSVSVLRERLSSLRPEAAAATRKKGQQAKSGSDSGEDGRPRVLRRRAFNHFGYGRASTPTSWSRYRRVSDLARFLLSRISEESRAVYRARYEPAASRLVSTLSAGFGIEWLDREALERIALRFPLTLSGREARELLGDLEFEDARVERAAIWFAQLSDELALESPRDDQLLSRLRTKLLLAVRLRGDERRYAHERSEVLAAIESGEQREAFLATLEGLERATAFGGTGPAGDGTGPAGDGTGPAADVAVSVQRGSSSPKAVVQLPSRWGGELPGGNLSSSPPVSTMPDLPIETSWQTLSWRNTVVVRSLYNDPRHDFGSGRFGRAIVRRWIDFPFVPVVDGNDVFLSGVFRLFRFDVRPGTGKLLAQLPKPTPGYLAGRFKESSDSPVYATTLWGRDRDWTLDNGEVAVDAGLPGSIAVTHSISTGVRRDHYMGYDITSEIVTRSLVAYDRTTGRQLWKTEDLRRVRRTDPFGPNQIPVEVSYSSPPVVRGSRVYAGGWKQRGYVNSLVRALDLYTGKMIWETPIGSSQMEQTMFGELAREPFASFLTEEDGVLYYQSNLGIVAALDVESGNVLWTTTYDSLQPEPTLSRTPILRDLVWGTNPPLLLDHMLIVTPRDSTLVLAIDTGRGPQGADRAGEVLWYHDNSRGFLRDFLGHHQGWLYFTGVGGVEALDISSRTASGHLETVAQAPAVKGTSQGRLARDFRGALEKRVADNEAAPSVLPRREPLASLPVARRVPSRYGGADEVVEAPGLLTDRGVLYSDETGLYLVDHGLTRRDLLVPPPANAGTAGFVPGRITMAGDLILVTSRLWISAYGSPVY